MVNYTFTNKAFTDMLLLKLAALKGLSGRVKKAWHKHSGTELIWRWSNSYAELSPIIYGRLDSFFGAACEGIEAPECTDRDFMQFEAINREVFDAFAVAGNIQIDFETRILFGQPL